MEIKVKTQKEILLAEQKEHYLAELFNKCMQLMNVYYRQTHSIQT